MVVLVFAVLGVSPAEPVRAGAVALELVLAVDCSSSVAPHEFALQMRGLADAFRSPAVIQAIDAAAPNGIAVTLVQWSGANMHIQAIPWSHLHDKAGSVEFAKQIEAVPRFVRWGATAIGEALSFSLRLFDESEFDGVRRVIDVSGDGSSNQGVFPDIVKPVLLAAGVTTNGLAILNDEPELDLYYRLHIIGGPRAFVERAAGFADFARAIKRKLIREIGSPPSARRDTQTASAQSRR